MWIGFVRVIETSLVVGVDGRAASGRGYVLVAPSILRPSVTAFMPSQTMATTGPELMYVTRPPKKGRSAC